MEKPYDIIAIGDTVVDVFIKLSVGRVEESAHGSELCLPYGAKIPYDSATQIPAVGNSANAAVAARRLGLSSALVTFLGKDQHGDECLARLQQEGVGTEFISQQDNAVTNYHYVLWHGDDRTILINHFDFYEKIPDTMTAPSWIYLSSLGAHTETFHDEITSYVRAHPEVKLAFQPGTFQLKIHESLLDLYKHTEAICMNREEAEGVLNARGEDIRHLLDGLHDLGPRIVLISDGPLGSYMKYDNTYFFMPVYPDIAPPLERTGAGDAFFSTFISYLVQGYDPILALERAPINSMNVVQHVGAQEGLLSSQDIEAYRKRAPENYKAAIIENLI